MSYCLKRMNNMFYYSHYFEILSQHFQKVVRIICRHYFNDLISCKLLKNAHAEEEAH